MFKKIKKTYTTIFKIQESQSKILSLNHEVIWANIFHDSIKGINWLNDLPLNPGRWAVNYSFLYILTRILTDTKPKNILELGLGESTKICCRFIENEIKNTSLLTIEQSIEWIQNFDSIFKRTENSKVLKLNVSNKLVNGFPVCSYTNINEKISKVFDLYIVDGPHGSDRFSRYDICILASKLKKGHEFIILLDDYERKGEQDTASALISIFKQKNIKVFTGIYRGAKSQIVICTEKYKFTTSY